MQHRSLLAALALALVLGIGGAAAVLSRSRSEAADLPPGRKLPDGTPVTLAAAAFGTEHRLQIRPRRPGWLRFLPERPPVEIYRFTTEEEALSFWLTRPAGEGPWLFEAEAVDDHGCRFERGEALRALAFGRGGATAAACGLLTRFPRREAVLTLRLFDPGGAAPLTEFRLRNPGLVEAPRWEPAPLPASEQDEDLRVEVRELRSGLPWEHVRERRPVLQAYDVEALRAAGSDPADASWTWLRLHLEEPERSPRALRSWDPVAVRVSDATGNRAAFQPGVGLIRSTVNRRGDCWLAVPDSLCRQESAWKLDVEFTYIGPLLPDPEVGLHLDDLALPAPGEAVRLGREFDLEGVTVRLLGIAGPGATLGEGLPEADARPLLLLRTESEDDTGVAIVALASDDRGRPLRTSQRVTTRSGALLAFELETDADTSTVSLALTGRRHRRVTFRLSPGG